MITLFKVTDIKKSPSDTGFGKLVLFFKTVCFVQKVSEMFFLEVYFFRAILLLYEVYFYLSMRPALTQFHRPDPFLPDLIADAELIKRAARRKRKNARKAVRNLPLQKRIKIPR